MATNSQRRRDILLCVAAWRLAKEEKEEGDTTLGWMEVKLDGQTIEMVLDNLLADPSRVHRLSDVTLRLGGDVRRSEISGRSFLSKTIGSRCTRLAARSRGYMSSGGAP